MGTDWLWALGGHWVGTVWALCGHCMRTACAHCSSVRHQYSQNSMYALDTNRACSPGPTSPTVHSLAISPPTVNVSRAMPCPVLGVWGDEKKVGVGRPHNSPLWLNRV